jgi:O-antigen/teichoic acid export membrane protein
MLRILNIIFPLITFPYVARVLSPEGIGKVDFAQSIIQYFILIAQFGIPTYAIRECAKHKDNNNKLTKTVQEILIINIFMLIISYLLFFILAFNLPYLKEYKLLLLISSLNIFSTTIGVEWFYQAIEEYRYITIRSIFVKLCSFLLIFYVVKDERDYIKYGIITVLSISIGYFINFMHLKKYISIFKLQNNLSIKNHIKPILMLFAMTISISIYVNLDKVMLGFISGDASVGLYSAANKAIKVVLALVTSLGSVLLPRMSYYINHNEDNEINKLISKSLDFIFMISIPSTIGIFMLAKPIIQLFAGNEYIESVVTIKIISPIILAIALSNLIGIQILISHGKEKFTVISTLIGATLNFTANLFLIPVLQQNGAAIGTLIAEVSVTILQIFFAYNYIRKNINLVNITQYIAGSLLIIVTINTLTRIITNTAFVIILSVFVSVFIYFGLLFCMKNELIYVTINRLIIKMKIGKIRKD